MAPELSKIYPILDDENLFKQTIHVAETVFEYARNQERWLEDARDDDPNPTCGQTKAGLFIVYENDSTFPRRLWTPWGDWKITSSGYAWPPEQKEKFLQTVGATPVDLNPTEYGIYIYGSTEVHAVRSEHDSTPKMRARNKLIDSEIVLPAWKRLRTQQHAVGN